MKKILTKVGYMAFGSLLTLIGYYFGNIDNNSANAQEPATAVYPENKIVDEVLCRRLVIVGDDNTPRVILWTNPSEHGKIEIYNKNGARRIFLSVTDAGTFDDAGTIEVSGKGVGSVSGVLGVDRNGGFIALYNKLINRPVVHVAINDNGDGLVQTRDRNDNRTDFLGPVGGSIFEGKMRK